MQARRYLSYRRARRALRLLWVWWRMPRRLEREKLSELLPSLDPEPQPRPTVPFAVEDFSDAALLFVDRWHLPLDDRCLPRTLSLYHCLRAEGVPVHMVFGIRPGEKIEEGHAWLEMNGQALLESARRMQGFVPIFHHPPLTTSESTDDETTR